MPLCIDGLHSLGPYRTEEECALKEDQPYEAHCTPYPIDGRTQPAQVYSPTHHEGTDDPQHGDENPADYDHTPDATEPRRADAHEDGPYHHRYT
jgi:hypothetical protein